MSRWFWAAGCVCACVSLSAWAGPGPDVFNVHNVTELGNAMGQLGDGDTIVMYPGTYTIGNSLVIRANNVTIRSSTGLCDDVTIYGGGFNNTSAVREAVQIYSDDVTIRDLKIEGFYHHAVHFQSGVDRSLIRNVHTLNIGEHHMKGAHYNYDGVIEYCLMEQTEVRQNGLPDRPDNYVGGIDLMGGMNFRVRDNIAKGIKGASDGGDAGIFLWGGSSNCIVERNITIGCQKGIALGNPMDQGYYEAVGCIVRNNFIVRDNNNDIGMELCFTQNCEASYNTVYSLYQDNDFFRTLQLYDNTLRPTQNLKVLYNLIRGNVVSGNFNGVVTMTGNIIGTTPQPAWFTDPAAGNLRLTATAAAAINHGLPLATVLEDLDGSLRPALPDVGADEYLAPWLGDANRDGLVDYLDLGILAANYRLEARSWADGDFTLDHKVDYLDLGVLAGNYRHGAAGGEVSVGGESIPEPMSLLLLALGAGLLRRRREQPVVF